MFWNEGASTRHNPEFTSSKLFWSCEDYYDMIETTKEIIFNVAKSTISINDPNNYDTVNNGESTHGEYAIIENEHGEDAGTDESIGEFLKRHSWLEC